MAPAETPSTETLRTDEAQFKTVRRFRLRVTAGPDEGTTYVSTRERTVVGTHAEADLVLRDRAVSRLHCEITIGEDLGPLVRDLGSRNGTRVGGVSVVAAHLEDGAELALGRTQIRFELASDHIQVPLSSQERFGLLVGRSRAMRALFALLERAAAAETTMLIQGETGTGKALCAESIHRASARRDGPLVVVDCGALPKTLIESELFGHEKGAFTGAVAARAGAFELASGGTLFLDEVGELEVDLQPKLLRVLEAREIRRVGGEKTIPIDLRVLAATNRDLRAAVNAGQFRADLYYRLAVVQAELPPLRERLEDIPLLVEQFLAEMGATNDPGAAELMSPRRLAELSAHAWPGNVRELRNFIERVLVTGSGALQQQADQPPPVIDARKPLRLARRQWILHFERRYLEDLLRLHGGNVSAAAKTAGVARIHLYRLMNRSGL